MGAHPISVALASQAAPLVVAVASASRPIAVAEVCFDKSITFLSNVLIVNLLYQVIVILNLSLLSLSVKQVVLASNTLAFAI